MVYLLFPSLVLCAFLSLLPPKDRETHISYIFKKIRHKLKHTREH